MLGQRIGNYRVVRQLGEGGMGVVYEAVRDDIGSRAAIKILRPEFALNADTAARFFNEARATNLIEHPGIVRIFDYGQLPNGVPYLAMELLSGESLYTRLQRERRFSEPQAIRLGRQIATVLAAAHAKEVIHRDLYPSSRNPAKSFQKVEVSSGRAGRISISKQLHALVGSTSAREPRAARPRPRAARGGTALSRASPGPETGRPQDRTCLCNQRKTAHPVGLSRRLASSTSRCG